MINYLETGLFFARFTGAVPSLGWVPGVLDFVRLGRARFQI